MTPEQKAIVKKLGRIPQVKGSGMWKRYYEPEKFKKELTAQKKTIREHRVSNEKIDPVAYQSKFKRAYND